MDIRDCVAVITGGGTGLGRATARALHRAGGTVAIMGRSPVTGKGVVDELGDRATFVQADVTDEAQVEVALDQAGELGPLRVVINCAGAMAAHRVVSRNRPCQLDHFVRLVEVNLTGTFNVTRLAAYRMSGNPLLGEERGVIVNTASIAAFDGQVGQAAYGAAKGGVVAMTLPLARDLASARIRVNTIAPGLFDTSMLDGLTPEKRDELSRTAPHPERLGDPDEFGALVAHVVANPMINGAVIRLDGGLRLPPR